ncbi:hypothetical protein HK405_007410 [Cladochytrium tenue]|nr:hypothetical protein HK405_007410 [Cladochytrium tenue]
MSFLFRRKGDGGAPSPAPAAASPSPAPGDVAAAAAEDADPRHVPNLTRWPESVRLAAPSAAALSPAEILEPLSDEQRAAAAEVAAAVVSDVLPELTGTSLPGEEEWADTRCILRYLRATKWDTEAAVARLRATLQWRREYRPTEIPASEVEPEAVTGKEFFTGFDRQGRPILYLVPANENTKTYDRQLRFVVYNLERGALLMPPGVEQFSLVIDFENISMFSGTPVSVSKKFLEVLGSHYPERLGLAFMVNPSWYLWVFFRLIRPFLDPVTKSKIHFVSLVRQRALNAASSNSNSTGSINGGESEDGGPSDADTTPAGQATEQGTGGWTNIHSYIDPDQLLEDYGGAVPFKFLHRVYWKHLTSFVRPPVERESAAAAVAANGDNDDDEDDFVDADDDAAAAS